MHYLIFSASEVHTAKSHWCEMLNAGNIEAFLDTYTEDCHILPPGVPIIHGKDGKLSLRVVLQSGYIICLIFGEK